MRLNSGLFFLLLPFVFAACNDQRSGQPRDPVRDSLLASKPEAPRNNYPGIDVSPMDMAYYPVDYPKLKMANQSVPPPVARIIYSRPHLGNRRLLPDILKHGEPWRLGANEVTEIQFFQPVIIQNKKIPAGRYGLYCIPHPGSWTLALSSNVDTWGLKIDSSLDVERFDVVISSGHPAEQYFTMGFEPVERGAVLSFAWDDVVGRLPISFP